MEIKNLEFNVAKVPGNILNALGEAGDKVKPLKGIGKVRIVKAVRIIRQDLEDFSKVQEELVTKYSLKDKNGNPVPNAQGNIEVLPANTRLYSKEIKDIIDNLPLTKISIPVIKLDDCESLTMNTLEILEYIGMIEELSSEAEVAEAKAE
jgi:hypothetical protein